ncbi:MAG: hypothetical protein A2W93_15280 [Bacteroidetes bacterium GWF2_43_63]|nr:MAG: hypothetical protein A2W94_05050 [Bacteroidetes bacterium GWE2_42_42]OFY53383.1 MAG: hypothetical protein A2W93_15280 [Bacteroidetes bacterium GWF2_43_63]HBG69446.1 hypothetical protein [Bacteroidales bacterium]HCB62065.1 hypothetical protein [Bacteroidales bacterium]HCY23099.1 hypothetical protein [Bacteroidales bacterium]
MKQSSSNKGSNKLSVEVVLLAAQSDHQTLALWAADCAERVLPLFADLNPDDTRPSLAIAAVRVWASGQMSVGEARKSAFAAHAAARESGSTAAAAVARSCGHAAATAHVAGHAIHAAIYAIKAVTLAGSDIEAEYIWQLKRLKTQSSY